MLHVCLQEAARRAGMEDDEYDPFEKVARGSDVDAMEDGTDKHVSWSYSGYLNGLDQEEVLNNVDHETFSSLSSKGEGMFC